MSKPVWILAAVLAACGGSEAGNGGGGGDGGGADGGNGGNGGDGGGSGNPPTLVEQYIRGETPRLVMEIDFVPGMEPRTSVESDLASGIDALVDKPGGITFTRDGQIASRGQDHAWTFGELVDLAGEQFDLEVPGDTVKMHTMFVDGHSAEDTNSGKILGLAWSNRHIVMFKQTIEDLCAGATVPGPIRDKLCEEAELAIWTHEVGHVIGLVDNGLPMVADHKDPEHGAHDADDECVMYWAYDGSAVIDLLFQQIVSNGSVDLGFGQACQNDIAAVRDR